MTRSNRFVLAKWAHKTVPPLVEWDERRGGGRTAHWHGRAAAMTMCGLNDTADCNRSWA